MKKKIFSFGLYREGIKQLRIVGILAFVILGLEAILIPVGRVIALLSTPGFDYANYTIQSVNAFSAHSLLVAMYCVFAPAMALILFSFLNKRNTSDFYHAIPHTRWCVYLSFVAAIMTWVFIIIAGTTLLSILTHLIFIKYFSLVYSSLLMLALNALAASALVVAAVAVAMTITGTGFTNIILAGLILFLPRFILTITSRAVLSLLPMVPSGHLFPLLANDYNAVTGTIFGFFMAIFGGGNIDITAMLTGTAALWYTAVLALVYFVLAAVLFYFRKSESAARSAPNRFMQAVYRITVTMSVCSVIITAMFANRYDNIHPFGYVVGYIFAAVLYFTYEIITTKKWKNLLRAIPGLAVVAVLNAALYGGMAAVHASQLNFTPSAAAIESVSVVSDYNNGYYVWGLQFADYVSMLNQTVEIKDKEVISLVADSLADFVNTFKSNPRRYYYKYSGYTVSPIGGGEEQETYTSFTFKIRTARGVKYRYVYIPNSKKDAIVQALQANEDYKRLWTTLPAEITNTVYVRFDNVVTVGGQDAAKIYAKMKEELAGADFSAWYDIITTAKYQQESTTMVSLQTQIKGRVYKVQVPLVRELMPESYALFAEAAHKQQKDAIATVKDLLQNSRNESTELHVTLFRYNESTGDYDRYHNGFNIVMSESGTREVAYFLLEHILDAPVGQKGSYAMIYLSRLTDETDEYGYAYKAYTSYNVWVALDDFGPDDLPEDMEGQYYYEELEPKY